MFTSLLDRLRNEYEVPWSQSDEASEPVGELLAGFLLWEADTAAAAAAFHKINGVITDFNELRVCLPYEIVDMIGADFPRANDRARRIRTCLNDIYNQQQDVALDSLGSMTSNEARKFLNGLDGMVPYVSARVLLFALGIAAMPVDDKLRAALLEANAIDSSADLPEVQAWLERQIRSARVRHIHLLLQCWVDDSGRASHCRLRSAMHAGNDDGRRGETLETGAASAPVNPSVKKADSMTGQPAAE